jgi:hypothetical protein
MDDALEVMNKMSIPLDLNNRQEVLTETYLRASCD